MRLIILEHSAEKESQKRNIRERIEENTLTKQEISEELRRRCCKIFSKR